MTPQRTSATVDQQFVIGRQAVLKDNTEALPAIEEAWRQIAEALARAGREAAHVEVIVRARKEL